MKCELKLFKKDVIEFKNVVFNRKFRPSWSMLPTILAGSAIGIIMNLFFVEYIPLLVIILLILIGLTYHIGCL